MARRARPGEFELIARYFAPLARGFAGAGGLRNDNAVISLPRGQQLLVKTDAIVAGVHFLTGDQPGLVARKALRVNLSDIAAGGGKPLAYQMALALPPRWTEAWVAGFCRGLAADQRQFGVHLCGGDTVATPGPLTVSITLFGTVPAGQAMGRGGARKGDDIWVSGTIGDAALGLLAARQKLAGLSRLHKRQLIARYRLPQPRLALAPLLRRVASASIDLSDGLAADLGHICEVSRLGASIDADAVPLSVPARAALAKQSSLLARILGGGDDYEILFTAATSRRQAIAAAARAIGIKLTCIGQMTDGHELRIERQDRAIRLRHPGFAHF
jgi:thiamine-monophosphate kinase